MLRRPLLPPLLSLLLVSLLVATPAFAGDWTRWPLRQLIEGALERTCEILAPDERPDNSVFANHLATSSPNSADALAMSAALLAADAARPENAAAVRVAKERLDGADKLGGHERPLVAFARATVALAEARHAKQSDERRALLARADSELAALCSRATGSLVFYARAARMAVAFERGDADELRLRESETLGGIQAARLGIELEFRVRGAYERKMGDLGDARAVLREATFLERARTPRVRRSWRRWTETDEVLRSYHRRWTIWGLLWSGEPAEAIARGRLGAGDGWHARIEALARLQLGEPRAALAAARRARNEDAGHAADELVAQALLALHDDEGARPVLEHSLRTKEGESCAKCLALLARVDGRDALAERTFREDDGAPEVLALRSAIARRHGDPALANALGTRAFSPEAKEESHEIDRLDEAFKNAMRFARFEEAEELAASFLAKRPSSQRALRLLALATAKQGDPRAPWLAEKLDEPQDAWSHLARGQARLARGALVDARRDLARAVALYGAPQHREDAAERAEARRALAGVEQALRARLR